MELSGTKHSLFWICLLALLLRYWGIGDVTSPVGDEWTFLKASENYLQTGHSVPDVWYHPPLQYFLLQGNILLLGDNPYGWRMLNVVMGGLSVFILILIGQELFDDKRMSGLAALFLAIEPFHIVLSRTSFREVPSIFFFLATVYFIIRHVKGNGHALPIAGLFLGLSLALKLYYVPALVVLLFFVLAYQHKEAGKRWLRTAHILSSLLILPLSLYLLAHYPLFKRGYGIAEFMDLQRDMYQYNQLLDLQSFVDKFFRSSPTSPFEWFIKPLVVAAQFEGIGSHGRFFVFMNNPPVWLMAFPAVGYIAYRSWKDRLPYLALIPALFFALYMQFALVQRPVFLYSALVVLPFVYLSAAFAIVSWISGLRTSPIYYRSIFALTLLWGLYLYPFVTSRLVPVILYSPLLSGSGPP